MQEGRNGARRRSIRADNLDRLTRLRDVIAPAGAVWVFWRKGRPELREDDIRAAAIAQGLVDVKVIRVSDELSGLKLVIPVALRTPGGRPGRESARSPAGTAGPG